MNWSAIGFDWNQARAFLAAAELGSLSAAARALGQTQPTVGRQVAALETALGVALFERAGRNLLLTEAGRALLPPLQAMAEAAFQVAVTASGQADGFEGLVRISVSDVMAAFVLPDILSRLRKEAPGIAVEVVASNALSDLRQRDADIAVRHVRPQDPDLVARLIREAEACFYASEEYVAQKGLPRSLAGIAEGAFVGIGDPEEFCAHLKRAGLDLTPDQIKVYSASGVAMWQMVRQGLGICIMDEKVAAATPGIVRVLPDLPPVRFPVWLVTHRELKTSRRIRFVYDFLAEELRSL